MSTELRPNTITLIWGFAMQGLGSDSWKKLKPGTPDDENPTLRHVKLGMLGSIAPKKI